MTVKGRLFSGTAIVKRLQAENIKVHPSDRLPFPLEFRNHVVLENLCSGATRPRKKFDDIFICFDTIPVVTDGRTRCRSKDRGSRASRGQKKQSFPPPVFRRQIRRDNIHRKDTVKAFLLTILSRKS